MAYQDVKTLMLQVDASVELLRKSLTAAEAPLARFEQRANQMGQNVERSFQRAGKGVQASAGEMQPGMQQLSFQLNDMATMFAMGADPMQIFASQAGQVFDAVQMMSGGTSRFAAFMGGPWGMAMTTAAVVMAPFVMKLFEADDALKDVEFASNGMANAQNILGSVMDLTTGKINTQNQALIALARAQLMVAKVQAQARAAEARGAITASGDPSLRFNVSQETSGVIRQNRQRAGLSTATNQLFSFSTNPELKTLSTQFISGQIDAEVAQRSLENLAAQGKITSAAAAKLATAYGNYAAEIFNQQAADQGLKALDGEGLGMLAKPGKEKRTRTPKGPKGRDPADIEADFNRQIDNLATEEIRAKLDMATTAEERAALSFDLLGAEKARRIEDINANKDFSAEQKAAQRAYLDRLYGSSKIGADGTIEVTPSIYGKKLQNELSEQETRLANDMLARRADALSAMADVTLSLKERATLEAQALELQQEIQRNLLEQQIASGQVADAEKARALLAGKQSSERTLLDRRNASPMQAYKQRLLSSTSDMNTALEEVQVRGLENLEDGLLDVIDGTKSVGDAFKDMANDIIADLARIAIKKMLVKTLGNILPGFSEGGPVLKKATGGFISGPGSGTSDSIPAWLSNGEYVIRADAVRKIGVQALDAINNGSKARFASGGLAAARAPRMSAYYGGGAAPVAITINAPGATAETVAMIRREIANVAPAIAQSAVAMTNRQNSRRRLS